MGAEPLLVSSAISRRLADLLPTSPADTGPGTVQLRVDGIADSLSDSSSVGPPCSSLQVQVDLSVLRRLCIISGALVLASNAAEGMGALRCVAQAIAKPPCGQPAHDAGSAPRACADLLHAAPCGDGASGGGNLGGSALVSPLLAFNLGLSTWLEPFLSDPPSSGMEAASPAHANVSAGSCRFRGRGAAITLEPFEGFDTLQGNGLYTKPRSVGSALRPFTANNAAATARSIRIVKVGCPQPRLLKLPPPAAAAADSGGSQGAASSSGLGSAASSLDSSNLVVALEQFFKACPR